VEFSPLDPVKIVALMAAGGVFALAGLWLMFRPVPESGGTKIKIFGLEFESSSAGLLVFLIGAAFLAVPLFVSEGGPPADDPALLQAIKPLAAPTGSGPQQAVILPAGAEAADLEPNEFLTEANQMTFDVFFGASLTPGRGDAEDWFVIPTQDRQQTDVTVQVRNRAIRAGTVHFDCEVDILNPREERIGQFGFPTVGSSHNETIFVQDSDRLYIRVYNPRPDFLESCEYEIRVY
jgi:hypothetical protein